MHDDVMAWKHFFSLPVITDFVWLSDGFSGPSHQCPVDSPQKGSVMQSFDASLLSTEQPVEQTVELPVISLKMRAILSYFAGLSPVPLVNNIDIKTFALLTISSVYKSVSVNGGKPPQAFFDQRVKMQKR